jgi:hypothetical protein
MRLALDALRVRAAHGDNPDRAREQREKDDE